MENPTTVRKIRIFFLLRQKDPFGELFSEIYFQSSSEFTFMWNLGKFEIQLNQPRWPMEFIQNCTFSTRQYRKKGTCLVLNIHTACNLLLGHSSELKVILNQIRFVYFSAVWKIQLLQFNLHVKFQRILEGHNSSRIRISQQTKGFKTRAMLWVYHI